jgi:hypothetical protein
MLRYRAEIQDAGMPMPAALTSMPMPAALTSMPMPSFGMHRTAYASCRKKRMGPIFLNKGAMSWVSFEVFIPRSSPLTVHSLEALLLCGWVWGGGGELPGFLCEQPELLPSS